MMILVAFLIAVAAISLMMTVLVASTRPLRAYDEPVFGARSNSKSQMFDRGPNWTKANAAAKTGDASRAPRPTKAYKSAIPVSAAGAPSVPGSMGSGSSSSVPAM